MNLALLGSADANARDQLTTALGLESIVPHNLYRSPCMSFRFFAFTDGPVVYLTSGGDAEEAIEGFW